MALVLALLAVPIACGSSGSDGGAGGSAASASEPDEGGTDEEAPEVEEVPSPVFDPAAFTNPTKIDTTYFPMVPGTQTVLEGEANRGTGKEEHQLTITVTDLTKVIAGMNTVVVWERDTNDGQVEESEITFFAQDDEGNVWNLGEYPEEYSGRTFAGAPSTWIHGVDGAEGGIHVQGAPQVGTPIYVEGRAPSIEFLDYAQVSKIGGEACAPVQCYQDALVVDEWDPLAQPEDGHQLKHYGPGVGTVRVEPVGGEEQETLVLTAVRTLDATALADARQRALDLDKRAYDVQPAIWGDTPPAQAAA